MTPDVTSHQSEGSGAQNPWHAPEVRLDGRVHAGMHSESERLSPGMPSDPLGRKRLRGASAAIVAGAAVIGVIVLGVVIYDRKPWLPADVRAQRDMDRAVEKVEKFMAKHPDGSGDTAYLPVPQDQAFVGLTVRHGRFQDLYAEGAGSASLEKKGERMYIVLHDDFTTPPGPELRVFLTKRAGPPQRTEMRDGLDLGILKSTIGKQVYEMPTDVDTAEYNAVTIHSKRFNVPWSYAVLE